MWERVFELLLEAKGFTQMDEFRGQECVSGWARGLCMIVGEVPRQAGVRRGGVKGLGLGLEGVDFVAEPGDSPPLRIGNCVAWTISLSLGMLAAWTGSECLRETLSVRPLLHDKSTINARVKQDVL